MTGTAVSSAALPLSTIWENAMGRKPAPERRRTREPPPDSLPRRDQELPDDLRRRDQPETPPDSLPRPDEDVRVSGRRGSPDGGNEQHPIHDEDLEDRDAEDYEREVDTARRRI
jgi:hypothetical protein